ncbi:Homoserine acetyltransferase family protein [Pyrenophora tritici-repentis]|nr:Homoserine acetyltransferase family protein [Pyrenophora tritici-repentis]
MPSLRPFPEVLFYDNVRAQYELVSKHLGVKHARAVLGWSMGAGQTYQWATQYPDFMDIAVPFCGSAKTSLHNQVFIEGVKSALYASIGTSSGGWQACNILGRGPRSRTESPWTRICWLGFSQAFYREKLYETAPTLGFKNLDDFLVNFWEAWALSKDPENMLVMAHTWQAGDCSNQEPYNGDFDKAMKEDSESEVQSMNPGIGTLKVFPSIWGHWAGGPGQSTEDVKWLDENLKEFFNKN